MTPLPLGTRIEHRLTPTAADSAAAFGNPGVTVVSTPSLIAFLEQTCHLLLEPYYEADERTVGIRVEVDHRAAAQTGQELLLSAELVAQEGRRLTFEVAAHQGGTLIMQGRHGRYLVDLARFGATGGQAADADPPQLEFWFDFNSPWCYLAAERIGDLARRHGAALQWRPVHLANLNTKIGGRRPFEENSAFVAWYSQDLQDWARLGGLTLQYHPDYPLRPSRALRLALYAAEEGKAETLVRRVMRAYWAEGVDVSDYAELRRLAEAAGLSATLAEEVAAGPAYKARLSENLETAVQAGIFGLPSVLLDGKIYFGNDRLELLERDLEARAAG